MQRDRTHLLDIAQACRAVAGFIAGCSESDFRESDLGASTPRGRSERPFELRGATLKGPPGGEVPLEVSQLGPLPATIGSDADYPALRPHVAKERVWNVGFRLDSLFPARDGPSLLERIVL